MQLPGSVLLGTEPELLRETGSVGRCWWGCSAPTQNSCRQGQLNCRLCFRHCCWRWFQCRGAPFRAVCVSVGGRRLFFSWSRRWCFSRRQTLVFQLEVHVGISVGGRRWCFSWRQTLVFQLEVHVGVSAGGTRWYISSRYTLIYQFEVDVGVSIGGRRWYFS